MKNINKTSNVKSRTYNPKSYINPPTKINQFCIMKKKLKLMEEENDEDEEETFCE